MPVAQYLMPDGRTAEFQVPDGTTPDQAKAFISQVDFSKLQAPQEPGALSQLGDQLSNRWQQGQQDVHNYPAMAPIVGLGVATGAANDVAGAATNAVIPDFVKQGLKTGADATADALDKTSIGQGIGNTLLAGKTAYDNFMQNNPKSAIALLTAGNVASFIPTERAAESGVNAVKSMAEGANGLADMYAAKYPVGSGPLDPLEMKVQPQLSPDALETGAKLHYDDAEKLGASLKPQGFADTVSAIKQSVGPQDEVDVAFAGKNPVTDTISRLDSIVGSGKPVTLKNLDNMDTRLNSDISVAMRAGDKQTAGDLLNIKGMLKNSSETVKPEDLVNPEAFDSWRKGDTLWSAKSKMQQLQGIVDNAYNTDNPDSAMRSGYRALSRQLAKNPQGWTTEEINLINQGAKRGVTAGALKILGGRLMSHMTALALGGGGAAVGGIPGAMAGFAAGEAVGYPLRAASNALQESRAMAPFAAVASRPSVLSALPQSIEEITKLPMSQQKAALDAIWRARIATPAP